MKLTEAQERWVAALESGDYEQGRGRLRGPEGYCCLGVACALFAEDLGVTLLMSDTGVWKYGPWYSEAPPEVVEHLGLADSIGSLLSPTDDDLESLADMNDSGRHDFKAIAAFIRNHPQWVFTSG